MIQTPGEILNHAYEYATREDILFVMKELELTESQVKTLLDFPSPLAETYDCFSKMEPDYMGTIRSCIQTVAGHD